jgi:hypothetical protein
MVLFRLATCWCSENILNTHRNANEGWLIHKMKENITTMNFSKTVACHHTKSLSILWNCSHFSQVNSKVKGLQLQSMKRKGLEVVWECHNETVTTGEHFVIRVNHSNKINITPLGTFLF